MAEHSKYYSPSALHRRIVCPGSALLEAKLPDVPSGWAAQCGTAAHAICEQCQKSGGKRVPKNWLGQSVVPKDGGNAIPVTQEMVDACDRALDMMRKITAGRAVETETRVELPGLPDMFGTIDVLVNEPPTLIVCDYKFGSDKVEVEKNPQLMAYALMAAGKDLEQYTDISLAIIQPKVDAQNAKVWKPTSKDLKDWRDKTLMPAVESIQRALQGGEPEYCPAPGTCAYCKGTRKDSQGKPFCPALAGTDRNKPV